jgi:hypothetical protein
MEYIRSWWICRKLNESRESGVGSRESGVNSQRQGITNKEQKIRNEEGNTNTAKGRSPEAGVKGRGKRNKEQKITNKKVNTLTPVKQTIPSLTSNIKRPEFILKKRVDLIPASVSC